jgi:hypothetical protein
MQLNKAETAAPNSKSDHSKQQKRLCQTAKATTQNSKSDCAKQQKRPRKTAKTIAPNSKNDHAKRQKRSRQTAKATAPNSMSRHTITAIPQYGREPDAIQKLMSCMSVHTGRLHENTKK